MICKYCNKEIRDNSVICPECGKRLSKASLFSQLYKFNEIPRRYFLCGLALLVAGIISLLSFLLMMNKDAYILKENSITYEVDGDSTVFYFNDWELDSEDGIAVDGNSVNQSFYGDAFAFFDANSIKQENDGTSSSVSTLYFANNKGVHEVAENVIDFRLSPGGKYIVYIDSVEELKLYNCQKAVEEEIDHNVLRQNLCVADDGSIVYLKKESDGEYMYIYKGGKITEYEKEDREPISVTNGAKRIFMLDSADSLYYYDGGEEVKVATDVSDYWLDENGDDIFYHADGKSYIYDGKGDPYELSEDSVTLVLCDNMAKYISGTSTYYGVSDFTKKYYTDDEGTLYYADGKYELAEVAEGVEMVKATVDGKSVVYICEGELISYNSSGDNKNEIADDVLTFVMTDDARHVYYVDEEGTLYVKFGKKDPEEIAEDVLDFGITADEYVFFTVSDGEGYELLAVKGTGDAKSVCDDLADMPDISHSTVKYVDGDDVYVSGGDLKFNER